MPFISSVHLQVHREDQRRGAGGHGDQHPLRQTGLLATEGVTGASLQRLADQADGVAHPNGQHPPARPAQLHAQQRRKVSVQRKDLKKIHSQ